VGAQLAGLDPSHAQRLEADGYIYAGDGHTILAVLRGSESRVIVKSQQISPLMKQAIVAVEDRRFFEHRGLDLRAIARAVWADIRHKKAVQGGSTITQQFVKNAYTKDQRTLTRKLKEAAIAWQLEQRWTKDRILTAYLNTIYFGNGAYGVERASRTYFGHRAKHMTYAEAALLAGIPADPSLYDPFANPKAARARRNLVLRLMLQQQRILPAYYRMAVRSPLPKHPFISATQGPAPYFTEYVKQQLIDHYGSGRVFGGGLRVKTTIDLQLQKLAQQAIAKVLTDPNGPTAALVAIRPKTGAVLAMVGGNIRKSQFNLAVQGERQPGSSFKPFVLAAALKQGISPATIFTSHPVLISLGDRYWSVHNYEGEYLGPITLATATAKSDNSVFAQLTQLVGPKSVASAAHELGITSKLNDYFAIGLGGEAVNPLEMARAYGSFADGGWRIDGSVFGDHARAVTVVRNKNGKIVDVNRPVMSRALTSDRDAIITTLLQSVVTSGTGKHAQLPDRPVAGKTGTTENYGDAWFVGYTPQLVVAVWVGYPNRLTPMLTEYHGKQVAGGTFPADIWRTFMLAADKAKSYPVEGFPASPSLYAAAKRVVWRDGQLQLDNGYCHATQEVVFFSGGGPRKTANCLKNEVEVPRVIGYKLHDAESRLAAQPLTPQVIYKPAQPKQRVDIVLQQYPAKGRLSSFDKVTLVMAKATHGLVPRVMGLSLRDARARLRGVGLSALVDGFASGRPGHVVAQAPLPGVAAWPGMKVRLVVARG
jgi:penicillin-binding protein 1A